MSYAGPSGQKNTSRPPLNRPRIPRLPSPDDRSLAFLAGVVVGATVGAGVALLLAPQSGQATRRGLIRRGRHVTRRSRDAWEDLADELRGAWERRRESRAAKVADEPPRDRAQRKSFSFRAASSL